MEIAVGTEYTESVTVSEANTAKTVGSGQIEVFATPMMIALMESAAAQCIAPFLAEGQSSVGTRVEVSHGAATPPGMTVTATAAVTAVDRRRVDFRVTARDDAGVIGEGEHTRFIIDVERFLEKAAGRMG